METETYAALSPNAVPNKHWFEIWSIENDGSLKNCVNFYDAALKDAVSWTTQCLSQESSRSDDAVYSVVHATRDADGTMSRSVVINDADNKFFNTLNKFKEALNYN